MSEDRREWSFIHTQDVTAKSTSCVPIARVRAMVDTCEKCHQAHEDEIERLRELLDTERDKFNACLDNHCESNMAEVDATRDVERLQAEVERLNGEVFEAQSERQREYDRRVKAEGNNLTIPSEHSFAEREKLTHERDGALRALFAMTERAKEMRQTLMSWATTLKHEYSGRDTSPVSRALRSAAGDPIP